MEDNSPVSAEEAARIEKDKTILRSLLPREVSDLYLETRETREVYLWLLDQQDIEIEDESIEHFVDGEGNVDWLRFEVAVRPLYEEVGETVRKEFGKADIDLASAKVGPLVARFKFLRSPGIGYPIRETAFRVVRQMEEVDGEGGVKKLVPTDHSINLSHPVLGARMVAAVRLLNNLPLMLGKMDQIRAFAKEHPEVDLSDVWQKFNTRFLAGVVTCDAVDMATRAPDVVTTDTGFQSQDHESRFISLNFQALKYGQSLNPLRFIDQRTELDRELRKIVWTLRGMVERKHQAVV